MLLRRLKQMREAGPPARGNAEDLGLDGELVSQEVYDSFIEHTELTASKMIDFSVPSRWISELERMFYGAALRYDEAVRLGEEGGPSPGPDALADALRKNVVDDAGRGAEPGGEAAGAREAGAVAALLARYVRRELRCLEMTDSRRVLEGNLRFSLDSEYELFRRGARV